MRIIHLSDIHLFCQKAVVPKKVLNKRLIGLSNWYLKRRKIVDLGLLDLLGKKIRKLRPDIICITGDLVHLAFQEEFVLARDWLKGLCRISRVKIVPGNHDLYIKEAEQDMTKYLSPFFSLAPAENPHKNRGHKSYFPALDILDECAFIGLSSAEPCGILKASGTVGKRQLEELSRLLKALKEKNIFRVILIHHPILPGVVSRRKELKDYDQLLRVLGRHGVELVLFGHVHKRFSSGPCGPLSETLCLSAPSATSKEKNVQKRAGFNLINISKCKKEWEIFVEDHVLSECGVYFKVCKNFNFRTSG